MFDDFPKTKHAGLVDPVVEHGAGDCFHLRPTATNEGKIDIQPLERLHQGGAMIVGAGFARDKIDCH